MTGGRLVKICGLTRPQDVSFCHGAGVDLTGFIFAAKSPRRISPQAAAAMPLGRSLRAGVFVEQTLDETLAIMESAKLDLAQLHGDQDEDFCRAVGKSRVMRAFWPTRYPDRAALEADLARFAGVCRYALFDAGTSGGGHGKTLAFGFLAGLESPLPWFLAGGLGPDTVATALAACSPFGLDINSGVEERPGVKDHAAIAKVLDIIAARPVSRCGAGS